MPGYLERPGALFRLARRTLVAQLDQPDGPGGRRVDFLAPDLAEQGIKNLVRGRREAGGYWELLADAE